ncbi:hypothetical protein KORDIASMS9_03195 [Kordia sp. SMS9]|uniref:hypothetical protein n=1 Tax=Kordia sp. SMS9 TaxID=2282170 RepID=UPI000E10D899|nr:hypothetical protein [Kordia sp. SMS9]AXG70940.1 hypothetical protein KORDIASMS9_03195 [Kordia sp. SMS9]
MMKKVYILLICVSLSGMFHACDSNYVSHSNVGKHVFQILKTLDTLPKETFRENFIAFEQLKSMINTIKEGEKLIPKIAQMTSETYNSDINYIFDNIRVEGANNYILWKDIEYVDYKHQTTRNRSMTLNFGTLFFKKNQENFKIGIYWLTDLNVSGLLGLGGLQRVE